MRTEPPKNAGVKPELVRTLLETTATAPRIVINAAPGTIMNVFLSGKPEAPEA